MKSTWHKIKSFFAWVGVWFVFKTRFYPWWHKTYCKLFWSTYKGAPCPAAGGLSTRDPIVASKIGGKYSSIWTADPIIASDGKFSFGDSVGPPARFEVILFNEWMLKEDAIRINDEAMTGRTRKVEMLASSQALIRDRIDALKYTGADCDDFAINICAKCSRTSDGGPYDGAPVFFATAGGIDESGKLSGHAVALFAERDESGTPTGRWCHGGNWGLHIFDSPDDALKHAAGGPRRKPLMWTVSEVYFDPDWRWWGDLKLIAMGRFDKDKIPELPNN